MLSVTQRVKATVSGYLPPCSVESRSSSLSTTTEAQSTAAFVGIDWESSACMFLPVGSTSGFRMGSNVLAIQGADQASEFVIGDNLLKSFSWAIFGGGGGRGQNWVSFVHRMMTRLGKRVSKKEGRPERCVLQSSALEIVA